MTQIRTGDRQKADILGGRRVKIEFGREREMRSRPFSISAKAKNAEKFCGLKSQNFLRRGDREILFPARLSWSFPMGKD